VRRCSLNKSFEVEVRRCRDRIRASIRQAMDQRTAPAFAHTWKRGAVLMRQASYYHRSSLRYGKTPKEDAKEQKINGAH